MNEVERQELQNGVVESIHDYFDAYDWDGRFTQLFTEWRFRGEFTFSNS